MAVSICQRGVSTGVEGVSMGVGVNGRVQAEGEKWIESQPNYIS